MGIPRITATAVALAGAATLAFTATAHAAPATRASATADQQLCGTVWDNDNGTYPWKEFGAPPSGAQGVAGVTISSAGVPTVSTDANGRYCLQIGAAIVNAILSGGSVQLFATPPTGWTNTSSNPWQDIAGSNITAAVYLTHQQPPYRSARDLHFTLDN
ncbi:hypothetical protein [Rhodococcus sp. NPDC055024]